MKNKHEFKFKVGDKVKLTSVPNSMDIQQANKDYEVKQVKFDPNDGLHYGIYNKEECFGIWCWYVGDDHLKLLP